MNSKHLAAIIVALMGVLFVQVYLQARNRLTKSQVELKSARSATRALELNLRNERTTLELLKNNSATMLAFLDGWTGALGVIDNPEAGEITISTRVKQAGLITLAQRFEVITRKGDTIPSVVRAHLVFEGDYAKSLNWLGKIEAELPSSRVTNLRIVRGETGNDIRMNLVLDLPVLKKGVLTAR